MILADKIIMLRKQKGWSQEELAERLDVSRQSVSKWEGNLSTPELDKIIAMSELFGVTTDYLLKDELGDEMNDADETCEEECEHIRFDPVRKVGRAEAESYLDEVNKMSRWIAIGVMLCILSPIVLILLGGFSDFGWIDENLAAGLGLAALFAFVAVALVLFIPAGMRLSKFEYLVKENIALDDAAKAIVVEEKTAYEKKHVLLLTVGVLLCVLAAAQLVVISCLIGETIFVISSVCSLLALVSLGVLLIVRSCNVYESFQKLLREGEYARTEKSKKYEVFSTIYWCAALAIYLASSFLSDAWHLTWVIWPVVAVLSPIIDLLDKKMQK